MPLDEQHLGNHRKDILGFTASINAFPFPSEL